MRRSAHRGISLVDLMVAFTVFSVAIMCVLTIFPTSTRTIRQARLQSMASHLAQSALEDAGSQAFASLASSTSSTTLSTTINGQQEQVTFNIALTVTPVSGSTTLKDVTASVTWYTSQSDADAGSTSKRKTCTLETIVADRT